MLLSPNTSHIYNMAFFLLLIIASVNFKTINTVAPELIFRRCSYLVGMDFHLQRCRIIVSLSTPAFRELLSHTKPASARNLECSSPTVQNTSLHRKVLKCWPQASVEAT